MRLTAALATVVIPAVVAAQPAPRQVHKQSRTVPAGTYTTTIARADLPKAFPDSQVPGMLGRWTLTFDGTGHYTVDYANKNQVVAGDSKLVRGQVRFDDKDTGEYACHTPAAYLVTSSAGTVHFRRVSDKCAGRVAVLTSHPLKKQ